MAIEAMKGAGMSYAGSSSASDVKAESQADDLRELPDQESS